MVPIIGDLIQSTVGEVVKGGMEIIKRLVPDKEKQAEAERELQKIAITAQMEFQKQEHDERVGQIEINKEEAKSQSLFVAGWRPCIGWICAASLAWQFIGYDVAKFCLALSKSAIVAPMLAGTDHMFELVLAMLGLGGLRSFDKMKSLNK
jgi:hypothetical protein